MRWRVRAVGWFAALDPHTRARVLDYLGAPAEPMPWPLIRAALASVGALAVIPMQDLLALGTAHRMNTPGTVAGNWSWRLRWEDVPDALAAHLRHLNTLYGRAP